MAMKIVRTAILPATCLVVVGCGGETLDVGRNAPAPDSSNYAGPLASDGGSPIAGPTPVATHQYSAFAVAVDDSRVYWTMGEPVPRGSDATAVRSCTKADCAATVITYAAGQSGARSGGGLFTGSIAVNHDRVFWAAPGGVVACPIAGCTGAPAVIAAGFSPLTFLADDQTVYLVSGVDATLVSCPVDGCSSPPAVVALIEGTTSIAADQQNLYWSEAATPDSGVIKTIPKDRSGPVRIIASGLHQPGAVAVSADRFYFAENYGAGKIRSCPISGCVGEPATVAVDQSYPRELAVDRSHAYWFTTADASGSNGPGQILECALDGCGSSPTVLAANQPTPTSLAIDQSFVFWTNLGAVAQDPYGQQYNDGSVYRAPIAGP
jgi:hypothetical protein